MPADAPPTLDPAAAARWSRLVPAQSPWLHEEVGRRMEERLQWIRRVPGAWAHWQPLGGGLQVHAALQQRYPQARCFLVEEQADRAAALARALHRPWWSPARWSARAAELAVPPPGAVDLVWANMQLHAEPDPVAMLARWHQALAPEGFLMFSCLGPDTLRGLRSAWDAQGWPPPLQEFTDMHDWGDLLVQGGFAEPVMDMERITLQFATPERALQELRGLGRNLHPARFAGLRGRGWQARMQAALARDAGAPEGGVVLEFEVIYGHAIKPPPRLPVRGETTVALEDFRRALRAGAPPRELP